MFSMSLAALLPLLFVTYALSELLIHTVFKGTRHWRKRSHQFLIAVSALYLVSHLELVTQTPISFELAGVFGFGLSFKLDLLNLHLMLLTSVVFFATSLYQFNPSEPRDHVRSFGWFFVLTYLSALGALMSNDLMAFFIFFEIMTFTTYGLIVRERDTKPEVLRVGFMYAIMGVFGGLLILSGIILLYSLTGGFAWDNMVLLSSQSFANQALVSALMILGFLVKAAAVPFHFWLVRVYVKTPFSFNALSSGILTKLSAFGLLKVLTLIYAFDSPEAPLVEQSLQNISVMGLVIIVIAALTMLFGVGFALVEEDIRKMLTFHSISQMGYILLGIGIAAYLGEKGALGLAGSLYHMVNHALFKSALFMSAGILIHITGETSMYMMGGILKKCTWLGILTLIPVLGITGVVGFNGYASKALLHHAVSESILYGNPAFIILEIIFIVVSAGTVTSFLKFYWFIFLNSMPTHIKNLNFKWQVSWLSLVLLAVFIFGVGLMPHHLITEFYGPITLNTYYNTEFVTKYLIQLNYFSLLELRGMLGILMLGAFMFYIGIRFDLFHKHLPDRFSAEKLFFEPIEWLFDRLPNMIVQQNENRIIKADILVYAVLLTVLVMFLIIGLR